MERYGRAGEEGSRSDPSLEWTSHGGETGLEGLSGGGGGGGGESYPERPDEPDCIYYLRTGVCGYGSRCRFNHPRDRGAVIGGVRGEAGALPERMGHPVCQHFMRTGTCKFGASCKYHHPRQGGGGGSVAPVSLSYLGYPLRPGEKECSYYLRTGQCKFGLTCRFNHPVPLAVQGPPQHQQQPQLQPQLQTIYPTLQSQSVPSSQQYGLVLTRPSLLPGSYLPSPYGPPMVLPPGMVPYSGWNPYQASLSAMPTPGTQPSIGSSSVYGITPLSPSATAYTGTYQSGPSSNTSKEFPQRPDQPECQYFMRTGDCKFGSSCRYHHPVDAVPPKTGLVLSSIGLPLRPGVAQCTHFSQHGICKFGPACRFDHSMSSSLSYSPSASSLTDMPVAPYPIGSSSLSGSSAPVSSSNEPTTEAVTAAVSTSMVSGLSRPEPAETSGDSASVSGSIEAKTSS